MYYKGDLSQCNILIYTYLRISEAVSTFLFRNSDSVGQLMIRLLICAPNSGLF